MIHTLYTHAVSSDRTVQNFDSQKLTDTDFKYLMERILMNGHHAPVNAVMLLKIVTI